MKENVIKRYAVSCGACCIGLQYDCDTKEQFYDYLRGEGWIKSQRIDWICSKCRQLRNVSSKGIRKGDKMGENTAVCKRCQKIRVINNKSMGWCRLCMEKLNKRFTDIKILPHPERYDDILNIAKDGRLTQAEIAKKLGYSRTWVNNIVSRYVVSVDKDGNERPR